MHVSLLFILLAGVLGGLLQRAAKVGMFEGFSIENKEVKVSHLQFADDAIIFCDNFQRQIRMLRCVLRWYRV